MTDGAVRSISIPLRLLGRAPLCVALGALVGFIVGTLLTGLSFLPHGTASATDREPASALLALCATLLAWMILAIRRVVTAPSLLWLFVMGYVVAWSLISLFTVAPNLQRLAAMLGMLFGLLVGALFCRLCTALGRRHG